MGITSDLCSAVRTCAKIFCILSFDSWVSADQGNEAGNE